MGIIEQKEKHWSHVLVSSATKEMVDTEHVLAMACAYFGVAPEQVKARDKRPEISDIRTMASAYMYIVKALSFKAVGEVIGGRDHSTILSAVNNHRTWMGNNKPYRDKYNALKAYMEASGC